MDWFRKQTKYIFETKSKARLGPYWHDDKSVRILNRIVEWQGKEGISYEAEQRHVDIIIKKLGLEGSK